jgi:hypothetical protein
MEKKCTKCKGTDFVKSGTKLSTDGKWQVYQCKGCGHKQRGELLTSFRRENEAENSLNKTTETNEEYTQTEEEAEADAEALSTNKEYRRWYIKGFKEALETVAGDLCEEPVEGYEIADYGKDYLSHANFIRTKDCLNCENPGKEECSKLGVFCPLMCL